jgi:two-component system CheB/CheR fusion protein
LRHTPLLARPETLAEGGAQSELEKVVILLRSQTGNDFSLYKPNTLYRRIERRMGLHQIPKIGTYVRYLRENPQEVELLFKELLIGVTRFFRDAGAWEHLSEEALPALLASRGAGHALRAWVAGCSTGEEAYSLAMVFKEALERVKPRGNHPLQIFATDLDRDAVDKARQGFYAANIAADVSPERLNRFFIKEERGYRVTKEIREMIIFAPQNLIMDPPFTKLDILSCRNLLIYLVPELQKKILPLFHYSLNPGGALFLGSAESVAGFTDLFAPLQGKSRLFRRLESARRDDLVEFPPAFVPSAAEVRKADRAPAPASSSLQSLAEQWLLQNQSPAAVLVNDQGDILFISGRTGRYLEPAAGKANWNVFVMAREGLRYELTGAFQKARRQKGPVVVRHVVAPANGGTHRVDLTVRVFDEPEALRGLAMIVFTEVAAPTGEAKGRAAKPASRSRRIRELEQELRQAREEMQSTREQMQTSQEELKSMNEELQSTNEELQSTNEELTTSKEEMQSMNEELQTLNAELQAKVDELSAASNDMKNLLNSTEIATVFLDNQLHVRRFTEKASKIIKLIPGDAGRPVTDLATDLLYPELADDAREVLRSLVSVDKPVATRDGRWYAVRLMPYRTMDDRIDGVVITFMDITATKKLESELRAGHASGKGAGI